MLISISSVAVLAHRVQIMIPIVPPALGCPSVGRDGASKKRKRNALPQLFVAVVKTAAYVCATGVFLVVDAHRLEDDPDTNPQYFDLIAQGGALDIHHYVAFGIEQPHAFRNAPIQLDPAADLIASGPLAGDLFTPAGMQKIMAAFVDVSGAAVSCAVLCSRTRLRAWIVAEHISQPLLQGRLIKLVTGLAYANHTGISVEENDTVREIDPNANLEAAHAADIDQENLENSYATYLSMEVFFVSVGKPNDF